MQCCWEQQPRTPHLHWGPCVSPGLELALDPALDPAEHLVPFTCFCSQSGTAAHSGEATASELHLLLANPASLAELSKADALGASAASPAGRQHSQPLPSRAVSATVCCTRGRMPPGIQEAPC